MVSTFNLYYDFWIYIIYITYNNVFIVFKYLNSDLINYEKYHLRLSCVNIHLLVITPLFVILVIRTCHIDR